MQIERQNQNTNTRNTNTRNTKSRIFQEGRSSQTERKIEQMTNVDRKTKPEHKYSKHKYPKHKIKNISGGAFKSN